MSEPSETPAVVEIVNIVATSNIGIKINLDEIVKKANQRNSTNSISITYIPQQFPGLVMKSTNPKSSILIFKSGKIVCTGTKQEQFAKKAIKNMHNFLNSLGFKTKENPIMIQNIVASVNLRNKIKLEQTAKVLPRSMYEPEQFPGIIHRVVTPASTVLLFASGKMVCVGTKSLNDLGKVVHSVVFELRKNKLYA